MVGGDAWLEVTHGWSVVGVIKVIMMECRGMVGVM